MDLINLKLQQLKMEEVKLQRLKDERLWNFKPYAWQKKWWDASKYNKQMMLMAANQVGKTEGSVVALAYHLTGRYPEGWEGYRFNHPIVAWALGVKAEQIKDVLQRRILGKIIDKDNNFEGGWIPNSYIKNNSVVKGALKDSVKEVLIKHETGGWSELSFYSYSQGQATFMGNIVDVALIDEEPQDPTIYGQILIRTANGDEKRGGLVMVSMTPEYGTTTLVHQFTTNLQAQQFFMNVTWADAPHLTKERQEQLLSAMPEHQREMRSKGIPLMGSGRIYPFDEEELYDDITHIPEHWPRINAIDFGWNNTALVWCAWDRDSDTLHVYDARKLEKIDPIEVALVMKKPAEYIPWVWPMDGHIPEPRKGEAQKNLYTEQKVKMLKEHAKDKDGSVSVEAGITRLRQRMRTGRLKVASNLTQFFEEYRLYHRKDGKVVKANDHILDALRYAEMMIRYAVTKCEVETISLTPRYIPRRYK